MNRFEIKNVYESEFERIWWERDTLLEKVDGLLKFNFLRGSSDGQITFYTSYTQWQKKNCFKNWTKSQAFRQAHKGVEGVGGNKHLYIDHPKLEGFETFL